MKRTIACAILIALLPVAGIHAQDFPMEQGLPSDTLFFMSCPDVSDAYCAFEKTGLGKILEEKEIQDFVFALLRPLEPKIQEGLAVLESEIGMTLPEILGLYRGEVGLAATMNEKGMPLVAMVMEFDPSWQKFPALIEKIRAKGLQIQEEKVGGQTVYTVAVPQNPFPVIFSLKGNRLLYGNDRALVLGLAAPRQDSLAANPDFQACRARLVDGRGVPGVFAFANLRPLWQIAKAQMPPQQAAIMERLGVFDFKSLSMSMNFDGSLIHSAAFAGVEGRRRGITQFFLGAPVNLDFAKDVPEGAVSFSAIRFDLANLLQEIDTLIGAFDPSGKIGEMYQGILAQAEDFLGFSLRDDFAASVGTVQHSFQYMPPRGAAFPCAIGMVELRDFGRFMKWSSRMGELMGLETKRTNYCGKEIYYATLPLGELGKNPFDNMQGAASPEAIAKSFGYSFSGFAFFIEDNRLYYSNNAWNIKSFLRHRSGWTRPLAASAEFQAAVGKLSTETSFVAYQDMRPLTGLLWNTMFLSAARLAEGLARDAGIPFDSTLLPAAEVLRRNLAPGAMSYASEPEGFVVEDYSSTAPVLLGIPVVAVTAAIAIPGLLRARMSANEASAIATLRSLAAAQAMFQRDAAMDQDRDGVGEYGYIAELCGAGRQPGKCYFDNSFGTTSLRNRGVAQKSGYNFFCYLPGKNRAIGETAGMRRRDSEKDSINRREQSYIIYAWPITPRTTGVRAFAINQSGEVWAVGFHPYGGQNIPQPGDAYPRTCRNAHNLEGNFDSFQNSHGGGYWHPVH